MLEMLLALPLVLAMFHGGQYIPPAPDPGVPPPVNGIVAQPGLGPQLEFDPSRWEWWFDFNQEPLLDVKNRLPARATTAGARYEPITADDRTSLVLPLLVDALRDKISVRMVAPRVNTRDVRAAAVLSLGRLQRTEAVPYIELVVESDPDLFVRTQALLALGFCGSPQAVETLVRLFRDEGQGAEIRTYAAAGLALLGTTEALDVLRAALAEKALAGVNNQLRGAVIYAAGLTGDAALGAPLRALAESHLFGSQADVRALIAFALGRLGEPASVPLLLKLLADSDNQVRRSAATAFEAWPGTLQPGEVEALIARAAEENDASARRVLFHALGHTRTEPARAWLQAALPDGRSDDRPHLALGLALDGHFTNAAPLLASLKDEHEASHVGALAIALGVLASPDAVDPLLERFNQARDPLLQSNLSLAMGLLDARTPEVAQRLEDQARSSSDVEVVRSSIIGLGLLGDRARLAALAGDMAKLPGAVHRAAVLHGLGLVGDRSTLAPLMAVARDESQPAYVRAYAIQALGELTDPRPLSPCWRLSADVEMNLDVGFLFELYRVL
ncbi:MAG TPA: HEAT repeat domain-containing protein [Planctomycetota bacterium]|nr:HEAT repeat domain-containing protein [Planctomycetota bacterium]